MQYVYILCCKDGSPCTGCTSDLRDRFKRHNDGHVPATDVDQDDIADLPVGAREHYHLRPNLKLSNSQLVETDRS